MAYGHNILFSFQAIFHLVTLVTIKTLLLLWSCHSRAASTTGYSSFKVISLDYDTFFWCQSISFELYWTQITQSQILFLCCLLSLLVQHGKVFKDLLAKPKRSVLCPWCLYKMLKTSKLVDAPMSPDSGLCGSHLSSLHCTGKCSCPLSPLLVNTAAVPLFACDYGCVQQHPLSPLVFACVVWSDPIHKLNPE